LARAENVTRIFGKVRDGEGNPLSEVHLIFPGVIIGGIVAYALAWFIMPAAPVVETGALASASAAPNGSA
jgi:hypothetical protein